MYCTCANIVNKLEGVMVPHLVVLQACDKFWWDCIPFYWGHTPTSEEFENTGNWYREWMCLRLLTLALSWVLWQLISLLFTLQLPSDARTSNPSLSASVKSESTAYGTPSSQVRFKTRTIFSLKFLMFRFGLKSYSSFL